MHSLILVHCQESPGARMILNILLIFRRNVSVLGGFIETILPFSHDHYKVNGLTCHPSKSVIEMLSPFISNLFSYQSFDTVNFAAELPGTLQVKVIVTRYCVMTQWRGICHITNTSSFDPPLTFSFSMGNILLANFKITFLVKFSNRPSDNFG